MTFDDIERVVSEYFKVKVSDLHSKMKSSNICLCRDFIYIIAHDIFNFTYNFIANKMNRTKNSIRKEVYKIRKYIILYKDYSDNYNNLSRITLGLK